MAASIVELIETARQQLRAFTGLELASTVSARKDKEGWRVRVEVVEKRSIPDSQDILAMYELAVDEDGNVQNFTRVAMRRRIDAAASAGVELEV